MARRMRILCCACKGKGVVDESQFRGLHSKILNIVRNASGGITLPKLVNAAYADDAEGGPLYANLVVQQIIRRINQRIFISGWAIKATKLGRGAKYRMVRAAEPPRKTYRAPAERAIA